MAADPHDAPTTVGMLMAQKLTTIVPDDSLALAAQLMLGSGFHHLPVVQDGALCGIVSDRDLLGKSMSDKVSSVMTRDVVTAAPDDAIATAAMRMLSGHFNSLPVVVAGALVGIVTATDILADQARPLPQAPTANAAAAKPNERVRSIMKAPIPFGADDELVDIVISMIGENVRHAPIVDANGRVIGIISDRDLRVVLGDPAAALRKDDLSALIDLRAEQVMTPNPCTISAHASLDDLAAVLMDQRIGAVPVVDDSGVLIGIVSYLDLIAALLKR